MSAVEELRDSLTEPARDIRLNLQSILEQGSLTTAQRWGVAIASAVASRNPRLRDAVVTDARAVTEESVIDDAFAAAALMGMNNIYYRFRHMIAKESYERMPARLRMQRFAKPATNKADFELFCLAVSAINGCEMCVRPHETGVLPGALS